MQKKANSIFLAVLLVIAVVVGNFAVIRYLDTRSSADASTDTNGKAQVKGVESCIVSEMGFAEMVPTAEFSKKWFLTDEIEQVNTSTLAVKVDTEVQNAAKELDLKVYAFFKENYSEKVELDYNTQSQIYTTEISLLNKGVAEYPILVEVESNCASQSAEIGKLYVSEPVYVTWTMDWEGYDISQNLLDKMDKMSIEDRDFPLTHFFNPRLLIDTKVPLARGQYFRDWVIERRDENGHEIQMHLHMFPDMVEKTGVTVQTEPRWGWPYRDDGYDILTSGYSYADMSQILKWSVDLFEENGLGTPTGFRAGGWFASENTLLALQDNGFKYDTSGRTPFSLGTNNVSTGWTLTSTTQPYFPSYSNKNITSSSAKNNLSLMEMPNNGGDSTGMTPEELIKRFDANYIGGSVANAPVVVTYLSHPDYFNYDQPVMEKTLLHTDQYLNINDNGPVKYVTLSEAYNFLNKK